VAEKAKGTFKAKAKTFSRNSKALKLTNILAIG